MLDLQLGGVGSGVMGLWQDGRDTVTSELAAGRMMPQHTGFFI